MKSIEPSLGGVAVREFHGDRDRKRPDMKRNSHGVTPLREILADRLPQMQHPPRNWNFYETAVKTRSRGVDKCVGAG